MQTPGNYGPLSVARDAQTIQFLQVLPATLMVYDCMLSLDDEVEYIWKKRLSIISVVYIIFRYLGTVYILFSTAEFIANENTTNMVVTYDFPGLDMWFSCLAYWFVQIILALRLYVLYGGSRKVLITIASGLVAEGIVMTVCVVLLTISADDILSNLGFKVSEFPNVALKIYVNYSAMVACECLLFSLAFAAAVRRHRASLGPLPANWSGVKRLRDIIIEGNVFYFLVNMLYSIVYLVVSLTLPVEWLLGILGLGSCIAILSGCHLILHVRSVASQSRTSSLGDVPDEHETEFSRPPLVSSHSNGSYAPC
ncbi:hypothetical protein EDD17DRAFT_804081 [Pisolithus thermaeus]|nr:hypothetical protein EV401DRAFT_802437 [Pisolithus croceorrhizus]KAI6160420.1 hypothetical protein EDD17DRAFT_804081 [Pisolithus thermaeus]